MGATQVTGGQQSSGDKPCREFWYETPLGSSGELRSVHPPFGGWNSQISVPTSYSFTKERERERKKKISCTHWRNFKLLATREGGISKRRQEDVLFLQVRPWENFMQKLSYFPSIILHTGIVPTGLRNLNKPKGWRRRYRYVSRGPLDCAPGWLSLLMTVSTWVPPVTQCVLGQVLSGLFFLWLCKMYFS